jgi:putative PIN family toxin of toxin-antitoxin system
MITVVLDANQYVSALLQSRSNSAKIVKLVHEGHVDLLISAPIMSELRRVLAYPKLTKIHRRTSKGIERFIKELEKIARTTPGKLPIQAVRDDPTDDKYLVCAVEGGADFIISGDHHLKDLQQFQGIPIVDPAAFLKIVSQEQDSF